LSPGVCWYFSFIVNSNNLSFNLLDNLWDLDDLNNWFLDNDCLVDGLHSFHWLDDVNVNDLLLDLLGDHWLLDDSIYVFDLWDDVFNVDELLNDFININSDDLLLWLLDDLVNIDDFFLFDWCLGDSSDSL